MTFDREQTLTLARNALHDTACGERCEPTAMDLQTRQAERVLPVIVRAVTDEIRALHVQHRDTHPDMAGQINRPWYCCGAVQLGIRSESECQSCGMPHPCPTAELCDQIDQQAGVQR